ncbi:MAG TPA: FtsX-like permease family protein [Candidatus Aphodovivens avistercoris]|nr:FtsX-like permease family protein [Candidatus Aphodovivens avistercoris]
MRSAFSKEIFRSITHSLGRFVAIAVIAALGAGFYAGLRMTAPDMKLAADQNFDGTNLMDIRVMSTLGLTDAEVDELRAVEGVEAVMPAYETDAMAEIDGSQYVVRVHSLDVAAAQASDVSDGQTAASDDAAYINRPVLIEGEWPDAPGECLLGADVVMDTDVALGDAVVLTEGTSDLEGTLNETEFTVVGFARSSYYASPTNLGTTSLGSGAVDQFLFVPETDFNADQPYTEAFVTVAGARDLPASSAAYDETVAQVAERIEALEADFNAARLGDVKGAAQDELDAQRADYEQQRADAEAQLADAEAQLDDAKAQLDAAAATIAASEQEIAEGQAAYDAGVAELAERRPAAEAQLAAAQEQVDAGRAALALRDELQGQLGAAREGLAAIDAQVPDIDAALAQANDGLAQAEEAVGELEAAGAADSASPLYDAYVRACAQREKLSGTVNQLTGLKDQRAQLAAAIPQLEAGIAQIDAQLGGTTAGTLDAAQVQIDAGWAELADAQAQLDAAAAQLESGRAQLAQGRADYESGLAEYESGRAEFEQQRADASAEFADAEAQLDDAQRQIDEIADPQLYVLDRSKLIGAESFESDANRIDQIAQVFPFIFFLVAALVSLTTMTRMVEEERVLIGTHKALGYGKARITSKYLIYALVASGAGTVAGIAALTQFLPYFIMNAYAIVYAVPQRPTPIDPGLAALSAGLTLGITLIATWAAAASTLRETPAALMQPRAPKAGKRILLERIGPVWRRLSFSWKVTARNIFRYKQRFFMAIIGIAGCTALLLTGLGLQNAINDIIDKQFYQIYRYTMVVRVDGGAPGVRDAVDRVLSGEAAGEGADVPDPAESEGADGSGASADATASGDAAEPFVGAYEWLHTANVIAVSEGRKDQRLELVVPQDPDAASDYVLIRERVGHADIPLTDEGVIVSEKLARELGLSVGDNIAIHREDDIGNSVGDAVELPIAGIMENYVSQYLFITPGLYEESFDAPAAWDTVYAKTGDVEWMRAALSEDLLAIDGVKTVGFNDEQIDSYRTMLKSVDSVVVVLIVAAAALAFVVLYNLTNINITERAREIATLKVLGFTRAEVNAYIFRETVILSIIGALVGLVLGIFLEAFVVQTAEVDQVMFGREIHAASFAIAFALTLVFTVLVMLAMRRKLQAIDMVESLKSNE